MVRLQKQRVVFDKDNTFIQFIQSFFLLTRCFYTIKEMSEETLNNSPKDRDNTEELHFTRQIAFLTEELAKATSKSRELQKEHRTLRETIHDLETSGLEQLQQLQRENDRLVQRVAFLRQQNRMNNTRMANLERELNERKTRVTEPPTDKSQTSGWWRAGAKLALKVGLGLVTAAVVVDVACWAVANILK